MVLLKGITGGSENNLRKSNCLASNDSWYREDNQLKSTKMVKTSAKFGKKIT